MASKQAWANKYSWQKYTEPGILEILNKYKYKEKKTKKEDKNIQKKKKKKKKAANLFSVLSEMVRNYM